jgi:hypothetical protein
MTITPIQAKVTKTATFNGSGVDVSGISGDWTLVLDVQTVVGDTAVRFGFQDTVDAFTTPLAGPTVSVSGAVALANSRRFTFKKYDFPGLRCGTASAQLRLAVLAITGTSPSVTYQAWLEY